MCASRLPIGRWQSTRRISADTDVRLIDRCIPILKCVFTITCFGDVLEKLSSDHKSQHELKLYLFQYKVLPDDKLQLLHEAANTTLVFVRTR